MSRDNRKRYQTISAASMPQVKLPISSLELGCGPSEEEILDSKLAHSRVHLNVGGVMHELLWCTLERLPHSRLGRLRIARCHKEIAELCDDYDLRTNEYFFDREPKFFGSILNMYRTGQLHMLEESCVIAFNEELEYWGLSEHWLAGCCQHNYHHRKELANEELKKIHDVCNEGEQEDHFGTSRISNLRRKIWDLMEKPQSSQAARVVAFISISFIILSAFSLSISTVPDPWYEESEKPNATNDSYPTIESRYSEGFARIEKVCIAWFTLEYLLRLCASPEKCYLFKSLLVIDLLAILPFYINLIIECMNKSWALHGFSRPMQVLRIFRVLRILKLARHSMGLQALGYTLRKSYKELGVLGMFVAIGVLLFATLIHFAEHGENQAQFRSIPHAFWWAIITMSTVGYGDMTPKSGLGKSIGSACCICGVLVVAMPIPIIVNKFADFYADQMRYEKAMKHKKEWERAWANGCLISIAEHSHQHWNNKNSIICTQRPSALEDNES